MNDRAPAIVLKTMVVHTVTYFVAGMIAYVAFDYPRLWSETILRSIMRPISDPIVQAGVLVQPIRGALFGIVFYLLRDPFFGNRRGWLLIWVTLLTLGIFNTFGTATGSIESFIYTVVPVRLQLILLPEVVVQSLMLASLTFFWVRHPEKRWLGWIVGLAFASVLAMAAVASLRR